MFAIKGVEWYLPNKDLLESDHFKALIDKVIITLMKCDGIDVSKAKVSYERTAKHLGKLINERAQSRNSKLGKSYINDINYFIQIVYDPDCSTLFDRDLTLFRDKLFSYRTGMIELELLSVLGYVYIANYYHQIGIMTLPDKYLNALKDLDKKPGKLALVSELIYGIGLDSVVNNDRIKIAYELLDRDDYLDKDILNALRDPNFTITEVGKF